MDKKVFLDRILPGNYFITKSMELTKSQTSGTLWYTKKFVVLYYYIFLGDNINTLDTARDICGIFDSYIQSLPPELRPVAESYFYASKDVANLKSANFKLFGDFAGQTRFSNDAERIAYYEGAKKYYFAFLMESGGQAGVKAYIKEKLYEPDFVYSNLEAIISDYADENGYGRYKSKNAYVTAMRNDYMAFVRNERQILFYYGFFHSKSSGSNDREFSSLTPIGELALHSNFYEMLAIWEHQKLKMISQPVTIDINGLENSNIGDVNNFAVNDNPYLTILRALQETLAFSKDAYQYVISRLPEYPADGIDVTASFVDNVKAKVAAFNRKGDQTTEDFNKEVLKYILGIRSDLAKDGGSNPLGLCAWSDSGLSITNGDRLARLIEVYTIMCAYKKEKHGSLFQACFEELKRQYVEKTEGNDYKVAPKVKVEWDMYNIHCDLPIFLASTILIVEQNSGLRFEKGNVDRFVEKIKAMCPNVLTMLGIGGKAVLKKELKKMLSVVETGDFGVYMNTGVEEYEPSIVAYKSVSLKDLEKKIAENSSQATAYEDGARKRNIVLIRLIKTYNQQRYATAGNILTCESCGEPTFVTYKNEPYVEYHHIIPFSDYDGPDHNLNIVALCPTCHRKFHFLKQEEKRPLYDGMAAHSYSRLSIEKRLAELFEEHCLKSYQLEFMLADNAIDEAAYNRILKIA